MGQHVGTLAAASPALDHTVHGVVAAVLGADGVGDQGHHEAPTRWVKAGALGVDLRPRFVGHQLRLTTATGGSLYRGSIPHGTM